MSTKFVLHAAEQRCAAEQRLLGAGKLLVILGFLVNSLVWAQEADPSDSVTFTRMSVQDARDAYGEWLSVAEPDTEKAAIAQQEWNDADALAAFTGEELLDLLVTSFAAADPGTARLLEASYGSTPLEAPVFDGVRDHPIYRNQVSHFVGRWLVQHRYYDEALPLLEELDPDAVADPAGLLFYRAVCQSELLKRSEGLDSLTLLLNHTLDVPNRFRVIGEMLQTELQAQKDEGMDRVADLMQDVHRRLDLGRAGDDTQQQEDAVIAALDKLLEQMEQQQEQQQQDQQGGGGGGGQQQTRPGMQGGNRTNLQGQSADGDADRKNLTEKGDWGMLDKKAEAQTRELIRQKFPSNFLDQIGRYTRKQAEKQ